MHRSHPRRNLMASKALFLLSLWLAAVASASDGPVPGMPLQKVLSESGSPAATEPRPFCASGNFYTTSEGDTCDSIALEHSTASAALLMANNQLFANCSAIPPGKTLCLPLPCNTTYTLQPGDTCRSIDRKHSVSPNGAVEMRTLQYNAWIRLDCYNLHAASRWYGRVLCLSPQNGRYVDDEDDGWSDASTTIAGRGVNPSPPPAGSTLAPGTTTLCETWYTAGDDDLCATMAARGKTTSPLLMMANPSLGADAVGCDGLVVPGLTYCSRPLIS